MQEVMHAHVAPHFLLVPLSLALHRANSYHDRRIKNCLGVGIIRGRRGGVEEGLFANSKGVAPPFQSRVCN